jgi:hypothetical protein
MATLAFRYLGIHELPTHLGKKFALVDVQISAAYTASLDLDLWIEILISHFALRPGHEATKKNHIMPWFITESTYQNIVFTKGGNRYLDDSIYLWLLVSVRSRSQ